MGPWARGFVTVVTCGSLLSAAACAGEDVEAPGPATRAISVRGCGPENALVPAMTMESCGGQIVTQIFATLIRYDPDTAEPIYEIAESIDTEDNRTWTITLEQGWTFHNGDPITAQSFVDAWNWAAYAPNGTLNSYFFRSIEGYEDLQPDEESTGSPVTPEMVETDEMSGLDVVDELTFTVTLDKPEASFPLRLGYVAFAPLPEQFYADPEEFGRQPIGSGPFEFVEWTPNTEVRLRAYDGYRGAEQPRIDEVTFRIYEDENAAYNDLQADNLDIVPRLPVSALADEAYREDLGDRYVRKEALTVSTITFAPPAVDPSLDDHRLRQAISMAIDRESIIDAIFAGTREPATGWVPPGVEGYRDDVCGSYCVYDPEAARELFAEAGGYDGTLTISYNADGDNQAWVEAVCHSVSNTLDVECQATPVPDFRTFRSQINDREMTGMFRNSWNADYPSIENFLAPVYGSGGSGNDAGYDNPEFDRLLDEAARATGEEAVATYNAAEALLPMDMPSVPLWYSTVVAGYSTRIDSVKITPFTMIDLLSVRVA